MSQPHTDDTLILEHPAVLHTAPNHHLQSVPTHFDEAHTLHELTHYLPSQASLKDFIHHNSLHAYQHLKFYPAIFKASQIFGYQVTLQLDEFRQMYRNGRIREAVLDRILAERKGAKRVGEWKEKLLSGTYDTARSPRIGRLRAQWKSQFHLDLDGLVHPLLFRIMGSYLDQGVSAWRFPAEEQGLLASLAALEKNGMASFFKTKTARRLLLDGQTDLTQLLTMVVGDEAYFEQYLFDQQFSHQGWSGIVAAIEADPAALLDQRKVSLRDFIALELLMEIDALESEFGKGWQPLCSRVTARPANLFADVEATELQEVFSLWQDAFEWSYYDEVLAGIAAANTTATPAAAAPKSFQAMFCIDERECSIRRHIERVDADCETLGTPGFFGVEFYFQPEGGQFYDKLCPAPVTPKYLIKETEAKMAHQQELLYTRPVQRLLPGFLFSLVGGFWALVRTLLTLFRPKMTPAISDAFSHMGASSQLSIENHDPKHRENNLQIGFSVPEMATRAEGQLRSIGLIDHFAPLVYAIGHGSSSANNPHHGAHDCGACSGRPGLVNARVLAFMANHPKVRELLRERGIDIPAATQFLGGLHDTAADEIGWFDEHLLTPENAARHRANKASFETALDLNAKERSRRFASISTRQDIKKIRKAIKDRSVSMFEPRPELGHGTNSLCIVGRRDMTKGVFLDRRAFLNSYDYRTDPEGKLLVGVMRPLGIVCGGINLEYYFSRVDNYKLGAGTKLPHHVMGLFAVTNSSDGDLRPGLPLQMIEVHDPVRLMLIVEHYPDVVLKTIQTTPEMYEWYINEWVHIAVRHPETGQFLYFKEGRFVPYTPLSGSPVAVQDFEALFEDALKMPTNQTVDATRENLPVYLMPMAHAAHD